MIVCWKIGPVTWTKKNYLTLEMIYVKECQISNYRFSCITHPFATLFSRRVGAYIPGCLLTKPLFTTILIEKTQLAFNYSTTMSIYHNLFRTLIKSLIYEVIIGSSISKSYLSLRTKDYTLSYRKCNSFITYLYAQWEICEYSSWW